MNKLMIESINQSMNTTMASQRTGMITFNAKNTEQRVHRSYQTVGRVPYVKDYVQSCTGPSCTGWYCTVSTEYSTEQNCSVVSTDTVVQLSVLPIFKFEIWKRVPTTYCTCLSRNATALMMQCVEP